MLVNLNDVLKKAQAEHYGVIKALLGYADYLAGKSDVLCNGLAFNKSEILIDHADLAAEYRYQRA